MDTRTGTNINHMIGRANRIFVVLYNENSIANIA
jgi:hypothetical protein